MEQLDDYATGLELVEPSDYLSLGFPSTAKDYEMVGSEEEQATVNGLKSFQPGMVGREMLPVRIHLFTIVVTFQLGILLLQHLEMTCQEMV